jgi:hypothetical protein
MEVYPSFSIGVRYKKKNKKKPIKKTKNKFNSKNISYYYDQAQPFTFTPYNGPRWRIPHCIQVSQSVRSKFSMLETVFSFREIKSRVSEHIGNMKFRFDTTSSQQWKPHQSVASQIISFYAKQENEWNKVREIYYRLFKFRQALVPLIFRWQIKKCIKNKKNTEDPVTLETPLKPVTILDFKKRISFVFEARSLKKVIENRLLYSDYMFPEPLVPFNILTNEPYSVGQLISISNQCKKYGECSWMLDSLIFHGGNLRLFLIYNKQKLKLEAINSFFKKSTRVIREAVIDFFNFEAEMCDLPSAQISRFINAYDTKPEMTIVQSWIAHTRDYYIGKELNEPYLIILGTKKTESLLNTIYIMFAVAV